MSARNIPKTKNSPHLCRLCNLQGPVQNARQGLLLKPEFLAGASRVDPNPESFKWDDLHLLQSQQVSLAIRLSTLKWVLVKAFGMPDK